jgi:hypothetical protein
MEFIGFCRLCDDFVKVEQFEYPCGCCWWGFECQNCWSTDQFSTSALKVKNKYDGYPVGTFERLQRMRLSKTTQK